MPSLWLSYKEDWMPSGPPPHKPLTQTHWPPFVGHHDVPSTPSDETRMTQDDISPSPRGRRWKPHKGGILVGCLPSGFSSPPGEGSTASTDHSASPTRNPPSPPLSWTGTTTHSPPTESGSHRNGKSGAASPHLSLSIWTFLSSTDTQCSDSQTVPSQWWIHHSSNHKSGKVLATPESTLLLMSHH